MVGQDSANQWACNSTVVQVRSPSNSHHTNPNNGKPVFVFIPKKKQKKQLSFCFLWME